MATQRDFQNKFQFAVTMTFGDGTILGFQSPDEVQTPDVKADIIKRYNGKLNKQIQIRGRESYGDLTIKGALQIVEQGSISSIASAIAALQDMVNSDSDTVDITINMFERFNSNEQKVTYRLQCHDCLLMSFKLDDLDAQKGDDAMASVTLVFSPGTVKRLSGVQITG